MALNKFRSASSPSDNIHFRLAIYLHSVRNGVEPCLLNRVGLKSTSLARNEGAQEFEKVGLVDLASRSVLLATHCDEQIRRRLLHAVG